MADVIQKFNKGLDTYLTKDQLREICPVAFENAPTNPNVTNKYLFVNTEQIVDINQVTGLYGKYSDAHEVIRIHCDMDEISSKLKEEINQIIKS